MFGKDLEVSSSESLFLLVLYNHSSLSGAEIVRSVKEDLGEEWSPTPGATYKIIQKLIGKGYLIETTEKEKKDRDKRIRKYSLTQEGKYMVSKVTIRMHKMVDFLDSCCPDGGEIIIKKRSKPDED
ncbi:MAG: PadR family transcriptional regulator [Candidatus Hodarchaeales archaeon]|jgi:DNA-binding PadR family transcriptional regulator